MKHTDINQYFIPLGMLWVVLALVFGVVVAFSPLLKQGTGAPSADGAGLSRGEGAALSQGASASYPAAAPDADDSVTTKVAVYENANALAAGTSNNVTHAKVEIKK